MELTKEQELEQLIGYVSVNSGTVVIVDPCYLTHLVPGEIYFTLGLVEQAAPPGLPACPPGLRVGDRQAWRLPALWRKPRGVGDQICENDWKIAVACRTTGDGIYPVYAKMGQSPVSKEMVVEQLIIDFKEKALPLE